MSLQKQQIPHQALHDEHILVVPRTHFFVEGEWQGFKKTSFDPYLASIKKNLEFLPRSLMEQDPAYKQIIPYLIFTHAGRLFVMQRRSDSTEQRLKNKYTLGIGGHIRVEDIVGDDIAGWAQREFEEEVDFKGSIRLEPFGMVNDDSNPVGQVHVGFVYLVHGDSAEIAVKSELKSGVLMTIEECQALYPTMETWSQLAFDALHPR